MRLLEGNIKGDEKRRVPFDFSGIIEPGMLTNDFMATRETLRLFQDSVLVRKILGSRANNRSKGRISE